MPAGHKISIRFTSLDVEYFFQCDYDWISMRSGNSTYGKFCGSKNKTRRTHHSQLPKAEYLLSRTNKGTLTFHSDYSNEEPYSGFRAHYIAVGKSRMCIYIFNYIVFLSLLSSPFILNKLFIITIIYYNYNTFFNSMVLYFISSKYLIFFRHLVFT